MVLTAARGPKAGSGPALISRLVGRDAVRLALVWVAILAVFAWVNPNFLTLGNLLLIGQSVAIIGIAAMGVTVAVISGSVDLSFPAIISVSTAALATLLVAGFPELIALGLVLVLGATLGATNGLLARLLRVDALLVTLATYTLMREAVFIYTRGQTVQAPGDILAALGRGRIDIVPVSLVILAAVSLGCYITLRWSSMGQALSAVGDNFRASRLSGLPSERLQVAALAASGMLAAAAGAVLTGLIGSASTNNGDAYLLPVLTAVVLSGASLAGGRGSVAATILAVFVLGTLTNGLNILRVGPFEQQMIVGVVLIAGLIVTAQTRR